MVPFCGVEKMNLNGDYTCPECGNTVHVVDAAVAACPKCTRLFNRNTAGVVSVDIRALLLEALKRVSSCAECDCHTLAIDEGAEVCDRCFARNVIAMCEELGIPSPTYTPAQLLLAIAAVNRIGADTYGQGTWAKMSERIKAN